MKVKTFKVIFIAFLFIIVLFMNILVPNYAFAMHEDDLQKTEENLAEETVERIAEEKVYCQATLQDDFADDRVIIVLNQEKSFELGEDRQLYTYQKEDFGEIKCAEVNELTKNSTESINKQINKILKIDNPLDIRKGLLENAINSQEKEIKNYRRIISLKLAKPGKENVLAAIEKLEEYDFILSAEPDYTMQLPEVQESNLQNFEERENESAEEIFVSNAYATNDDRFDEQWAINKLGLPFLWDDTTGTDTIKVGVLDSGIDASHSDLSSNINTSLSRDFTQGSTIKPSVLTDENGHGTHVAGIIGAKGNNGIGIAGVCWNVDLISLQVFDETGFGELSYLVSAIDYAENINIPILNFSGGSYANSSSLKQAIENYSGLLVCAAGNYNTNNDVKPFYPASYSDIDNILSVGNLTSAGVKASDSNYGATTVDIFAPGDNILSTYPTSLDSSGYKSLGGTSMAAPYVTGVAALYLSQQTTMTALQLKQKILAGAVEDTTLNDLCSTEGRLCVVSDMALEPKIVSKSFTVWKIRIYNPNDASRIVHYNEKMCFEDDAKNWNKLFDLKTITIPANSYEDVEISENFFATHIAISYILAYRVVSYANELNTSGRINTYYSKI